jgi:hypothetical protein
VKCVSSWLCLLRNYKGILVLPRGGGKSKPGQVLSTTHGCCRHVLDIPSTYLLTHLLTYSIENSPSWEANPCSGSHEIPRVLYNTKVHYRIHRCPPPVPVLRQLDPAMPPHPTSWKSILILSSHLRLALPSGLLPLGFPAKTLYTPHLSTITQSTGHGRTFVTSEYHLPATKTDVSKPQPRYTPDVATPLKDWWPPFQRTSTTPFVLFHCRTVEATEIQELLLNRKNNFRQRGNLLLASRNA